MFGTEQLLACNGGFISFSRQDHSTLKVEHTIDHSGSKSTWAFADVSDGDFIRAHDIVRITIQADPNFKIQNPVLRGVLLGDLTNGTNVYVDATVSISSGKYKVVYEFEMPQDNLTLAYTTRSDILTIFIGDIGESTVTIRGQLPGNTSGVLTLKENDSTTLLTDESYTYTFSTDDSAVFESFTLTEAGSSTGKKYSSNGASVTTGESNLTLTAVLKYKISVTYVNHYDGEVIVTEYFKNGATYYRDAVVSVIPEPSQTAWDSDAVKKNWCRPGSTNGGTTFPAFSQDVVIANSGNRVTIELYGKLQTCTLTPRDNAGAVCHKPGGDLADNQIRYYRYGQTLTVYPDNLTGYNTPGEVSVGGYQTSYSANFSGYVPKTYNVHINWQCGETWLGGSDYSFVFGHSGSVQSPDIDTLHYTNPHETVWYGGWRAENYTIFVKTYKLAAVFSFIFYPEYILQGHEGDGYWEIVDSVDSSDDRVWIDDPLTDMYAYGTDNKDMSFLGGIRKRGKIAGTVPVNGNKPGERLRGIALTYEYTKKTYRMNFMIHKNCYGRKSVWTFYVNGQKISTGTDRWEEYTDCVWKRHTLTAAEQEKIVPAIVAAAEHNKTATNDNDLWGVEVCAFPGDSGPLDNTAYPWITDGWWWKK